MSEQIDHTESRIPVIVSFVLTHEYSDRSAFSICGITDNHSIATTWFNANDENNVYEIPQQVPPTNWMDGYKGWKEVKKNA
jgi:hypothetical protein